MGWTAGQSCTDAHFAFLSCSGLLLFFLADVEGSGCRGSSKPASTYVRLIPKLVTRVMMVGRKQLGFRIEMHLITGTYTFKYIWRSSFIEAWKNKYDSNNRTACSTTIIAVKIYFWLDEEGHTDGMRTWQRTARLMHSTGWLHDEALRQCATYLSQTHLGLGSLSH